MTKQTTNISKHLSIHSFFKSISNAFISLFVPIIILQNIGYKMSLLYIIILSCSTVIGLFIFMKLITQNPILSIIIHIFFLLGSYILISVFPINTITTIFNAIFNGLGQALYNASILSIISSNKSKSEFSYYHIFSFLGSACIILFNGYILNLNLSFSTLITCLVSFVFFTFSLIPFFLVKNKLNVQKEKVALLSVIKKTKYFNIFHASFGLQELIVSLVLPIYLAINNLSIQSIAIVVAIINIFKIFVTMITNKMYQKGHSYFCIVLGCIIFAISSFILPISTTKTLIYVISVLLSITFPLFFISNCNSYSEQTKDFSYSAMIVRELFIHVLRPIVILPFIFIENLKSLIYFGIILSITMVISAYLFLNKKINNTTIH